MVYTYRATIKKKVAYIPLIGTLHNCYDILGLRNLLDTCLPYSLSD